MDHSPFARLPAELRNHIYDLALVDAGRIEVNRNLSTHWNPPPLLQACRQLRNEASPVYYGNNTFTIEHWNALKALETWLRAIGPDARGFLRKILMGCGYEALGPEKGLRRDEESEEALNEREVGISGAVLLVGDTRRKVEARWRQMR